MELMDFDNWWILTTYGTYGFVELNNLMDLWTNGNEWKWMKLVKLMKDDNSCDKDVRDYGENGVWWDWRLWRMEIDEKMEFDENGDYEDYGDYEKVIKKVVMKTVVMMKKLLWWSCCYEESCCDEESC